MGRQEEVQNVVDNLRKAVPDLKGALVASVDGLAIAQSLSGGDPNRISAMAATALGLGKRILESFNAGGFSETAVVGGEMQFLIYAAGAKGVLAVVATNPANVGLIHLEARDAAKQIASIL